MKNYHIRSEVKDFNVVRETILILLAAAMLSVRSVVFSNLIVTSLQPAGSLDFCRLNTIYTLLYK